MAYYCRQCGTRIFFSDEMNGGLCSDCRRDRQEQEKKERKREEERERREREREREREWNEERRHQELMEQQERLHEEMLDATLSWYNCEHCGKRFREDDIGRTTGTGRLCPKCCDREDLCQSCGKTYVVDKVVVRFEKDKSFAKKGNKVEFVEKCWAESSDSSHAHSHGGKTAFTQYDAIQRWERYICPACEKKSRAQEKDLWDDSKKFEVEYDRLKSIKEREDREAKENRARKEKESQKKSEQKFSAGCLGIILLAAILIVAYFNEVNMVAAAIVGGVILALSIILKSFTSRIFNGLIFGVVFTIIFGLIISGIYWFFRDAFLVPLAVCFAGSTILGTILDAVGILDKIKERQ